MFQDDLFPPTRITWLETQTSFEWFAQNDKQPLKINLKPDNMMNRTLTIIDNFLN